MLAVAGSASASSLSDAGITIVGPPSVDPLSFTAPTPFAPCGPACVPGGGPTIVDVVTTPTGFRVTNYTLTYDANSAQDGASGLTVGWIVREPINAAVPVPIFHLSHLDGTLSESGGIAVTDIEERTITTGTDEDLNFLDINGGGGLLAQGDFSGDLTTGPYPQFAGNDELLQFFVVKFDQGTTTGSDGFSIALSSSAESDLAVVNEPAPMAILAIAVAGLALTRRRTA